MAGQLLLPCVRFTIACWTGEVGEPAEALRLFGELLPDQVRVLGAAHPDTLLTRNSVAFWTGEVGESAEALRLSGELLPDQVQVLGAAHPDTLSTQRRIAFEGEAGPGQAR